MTRYEWCKPFTWAPPSRFALHISKDGVSLELNWIKPFLPCGFRQHLLHFNRRIAIARIKREGGGVSLQFGVRIGVLSLKAWKIFYI